MRPRRPSVEEVSSAEGKTVADVIASGLEVLFCGINPGLYSGAVGHHFARPGNRFWPALDRSGFTPRLLSPFEEEDLLGYGLGITNIVARATGSASALEGAELRRGGLALERKVRRRHPAFVAFLGVSAYRTAFVRPKAAIGPQPETIGASRLWVLPNPSGLNAHHQLDDLVRELTRLRRTVRAGKGPASGVGSAGAAVQVVQSGAGGAAVQAVQSGAGGAAVQAVQRCNLHR